MKVEKTCLTCGQQFSVDHWRVETATTCSQKCRGVQIARAYAEQRVELECRRCGTKFKVPPCHADRRIYCSPKCAAPARASATNRMQDKHYRWNGGVAKHPDGYLYWSIPNHPFGMAGSHYVLAHRIVMETWLREEAPDHPFLTLVDDVLYLKDGIEIHHINEVKADNRRRNLLACTAAAHRDIHSGRPPMQGEVWPEIKGLRPFTPRYVQCTCGTCGQQFRKRATEVAKGEGKFCTRDCYNRRPKTTFQIQY